MKLYQFLGACAAINGLICSGLDTTRFLFVGFLPAKTNEKRKKLEELKNETSTMIFYEAPHKIKDTLNNMLNIIGDRKISIGRELTKIHEEFIRGKISSVINEIEIKGEYVLILEGAEKSEDEIKMETINKMTVEAHYKYYEKMGLEKKEIIKKIAHDRNVPKDDIYKKFIDN